MKEISNETIEKISETKLENSRQKIMAALDNNDIPKQSSTHLAVPSHRTREWLTFEEFKEFIQQGKTLKELIQKYSKHLIAFYSYLSQGKVKLSKEQFIQEYEKGVSLDEIAKTYNIPREHISYLREFYGIKRKGATYQKRLANEKPLSQETKDVIIGSILGDGHITKWGYFSEKHSPEQLEYLKWKVSFFKDITTDKSWDYYEAIDKRSGNLIKYHSFRTTAHSFLYEMRNKFYKQIDGKWTKVIPNDIGDMINKRVLAVWFMDDGCTDWGYRNGKKEWANAKPQCKISSESFTMEENLMLKKILEEKYNLVTNVRFKESKNNEKPYLRFLCESSVKLINITKKFSTSDLLYKFEDESLKFASN